MAKTIAITDELDDLITTAIAAKTGNLPGTSDNDAGAAEGMQKKTPEIIGGSSRAGDRGRTGDVQLGKRRKPSSASFRKR
jgi:hypothetical protein